MASDLLDPKNDYVFKRLLVDSPALLSALINAVRYDRPPVQVVQVLNPAILPAELEGKAIVLDVLATDTEGRRFNIEMQARRHPDWIARSVFYLARTLTQQLNDGESYQALRSAVGIHLLDFSLFDEPRQALWRFQLRDERQPTVKLGEELELNLLELPKVPAAGGDLPAEILAWVQFFEHWNEETAMAQIDDPAVREARRKLERISGDAEERIRAELREKAMRDELSFRLWERQQGREEGRLEGLLEGEVILLERLLTRRFGSLPGSIKARLRSADPVSLELWAERVLEAPSLEAVFAAD